MVKEQKVNNYYQVILQSSEKKKIKLLKKYYSQMSNFEIRKIIELYPWLIKDISSNLFVSKGITEEELTSLAINNNYLPQEEDLKEYSSLRNNIYLIKYLVMKGNISNIEFIVAREDCEDIIITALDKGYIVNDKTFDNLLGSKSNSVSLFEEIVLRGKYNKYKNMFSSTVLQSKKAQAILKLYSVPYLKEEAVLTYLTNISDINRRVLLYILNQGYVASQEFIKRTNIDNNSFINYSIEHGNFRVLKYCHEDVANVYAYAIDKGYLLTERDFKENLSLVENLVIQKFFIDQKDYRFLKYYDGVDEEIFAYAIKGGYEPKLEDLKYNSNLANSELVQRTALAKGNYSVLKYYSRVSEELFTYAIKCGYEPKLEDFKYSSNLANSRLMQRTALARGNYSVLKYYAGYDISVFVEALNQGFIPSEKDFKNNINFKNNEFLHKELIDRGIYSFLKYYEGNSKEIFLYALNQGYIPVEEDFKEGKNFRYSFLMQKIAISLGHPEYIKYYNGGNIALVLDTLKVDKDDILKKIKYLLNYKFEQIWSNYLLDNSQTYSLLSRNLVTYLKEHSVKDTVLKYNEQIINISRELDINLEEVFVLFEDFKKNPNDINLERIIKLIRTFNSASKQNLINKKVEEEKDFIRKTYMSLDRSKVRNIISKEKQKKLYLSSLTLTSLNSQYEKIRTFFPNLKQENTRELIATIINNQSDKAMDILEINKPTEYSVYLKEKSLIRLKNNYLNLLGDFTPQELDLVNKYFLNSINYSELQLKIEKKKLKIITDIIPLLEEAEAKLSINGNELDFTVSYNSLTEAVRRESKLYEEELKKFKKVKSLIMNNVYNEEVEVTLGEIDDYPKNDNVLELDYSKLKENYVFNSIVSEFLIREKTKKEQELFKELFIEKGLLLQLALIEENDILKILLENIKLLEYQSLELSNIKSLIKRAELYGYLHDETERQILGDDIIKKIIYNETYIGVSSKMNRSKRISNAVNYNVKSIGVTSSSIPYVKVDNLANRYKNNDVGIFASGIDTDSCFKIMGTDNDFLLYTIFSKHGIVLKITDEDGHFVGRCSGFRNGNILYFNQARTIYDSHGNPTKKVNEVQKQIRKVIEEFSRKIILATTDSDYPIEHVVITKSYSYSGSSDLKLVKTSLIKESPLNVKGDDYRSFLELEGVRDYSKTGFVTDYMSGYRILLLASKEGCKLETLHDIKEYDAPAMYERPRKKVIISTTNINEYLDEINRIMAISCYIGDEYSKYEKRIKYKPLINLDNISYIALGEDWFCLIDKQGKKIATLVDLDKRAKEEFIKAEHELQEYAIEINRPRRGGK